MLYVPSTSDFALMLGAPAIARLAAAYGTTVTPGNNTKGSYATLLAGASVTDDVYGICINFNSNFLAAATRSTICDIGIDPAGGTTFSVLIPDLIASNAGTLCADREANGGYNYYFPLFIKAGTSIGCAASVNNATVGTLRCQAYLFCKPKYPESIKVGSFVEAIGVVAATSKGTTVTSGTTSEGSWTSLGTTTKKCWWFQAAHSTDVLIAVNAGYAADLSAGAAGGEQILVQEAIHRTNNTDDSEGLSLALPMGGEVVAGATIWGRLQCSGTADTSSMVGYGLG